MAVSGKEHVAAALETKRKAEEAVAGVDDDSSLSSCTSSDDESRALNAAQNREEVAAAAAEAEQSRAAAAVSHADHEEPGASEAAGGRQKLRTDDADEAAATDGAAQPRDRRQVQLSELFCALDSDGSGSIDGAEVMTRMSLLELGPLRAKGTQLNAMVTKGMLEGQFVEVLDGRLPKEDGAFEELMGEFMEVAMAVSGKEHVAAALEAKRKAEDAAGEALTTSEVDVSATTAAKRALASSDFEGSDFSPSSCTSSDDEP